MRGNQRQRNPGASGGAEKNLLDHPRAGIGIDPDVHQISPCCLSLSFSQAKQMGSATSACSLRGSFTGYGVILLT